MTPEKEKATLRPEFDRCWPDMWKRIGPILDQEPNLHIAAQRSAWIVWRAATENFLKQPTNK